MNYFSLLLLVSLKAYLIKSIFPRESHPKPKARHREECERGTWRLATRPWPPWVLLLRKQLCRATTYPVGLRFKKLGLFSARRFYQIRTFLGLLKIKVGLQVLSFPTELCLCNCAITYYIMKIQIQWIAPICMTVTIMKGCKICIK